MGNPFGAKPNPLSKAAVEHPVRIAIVSAVTAVGMTFTGNAITMGRGTALVVAAVVGTVMFFVQWLLWRPGGAGAKWYARRTAVEGEPTGW